METNKKKSIDNILYINGGDTLYFYIMASMFDLTTKKTISCFLL